MIPVVGIGRGRAYLGRGLGEGHRLPLVFQILVRGDLVALAVVERFEHDGAAALKRAGVELEGDDGEPGGLSG